MNIAARLATPLFSLALTTLWAQAAHATTYTTFYLNNSAGSIFSLDFDGNNFGGVTLVNNNLGAYSIATEPNDPNTLYVQTKEQVLRTYDLNNGNTSTLTSAMYGVALAMNGAGHIYGGNGSPPAILYRFDLTDSSMTSLGAGEFPYAGDIAIIGNVLYGAVSTIFGPALVTVNPATGSQTFIGRFTLSSGPQPIVVPAVFGLAFAHDGFLYAAGPTSNGASALYRVDTGSGNSTLVWEGAIGSVFDMASSIRREPSPPDVPEPSALAVIGAGVAVAIGRRSTRERDRL